MTAPSLGQVQPISVTGRQWADAAPALANILGMTYGVQIRTGSPKTDGKTIWLPKMPSDASEDTIWLMRGHLVHEAGHCRVTNFDLLRQEKASGLRKAVWNAVEDVFLEKEMIATYRGARRSLNESTRVMIDRGEIKTGENSAAEAAVIYPLYWGSVKVNDLDTLQPLYKDVRVKLGGQLGLKGLRKLDALLAAEMPNLSSSQDCLALTDKILDLLQQIAEDQDDEEEDDNDENEPGDGERSEDDATDGDDDAGDGSPQSGEPGDQDLPGKGSGASDILEDDSADLENPAIDRGKGLEDKAEEDFKEGRGGGAGNGVIDGVSDMPVHRDRQRYQKLYDEVRGRISVIQRRLVSLLVQAQQANSYQARRGRLNSARLAGVLAGNDRVFKQTEEGETLDCALSVLVDASGSMSGANEEMASRVLIALTEAAKAAGFSYEASLFEGDTFKIIKGFGEACEGPVRERLGGLNAEVGGGTPLGDAMFQAGVRLSMKPEARKVMLVLTDGMPNDGAAVSQMVTRLRGMGIEVIGVGILTDAVKNFFPQHAVVNDLDDLGPRIFECLAPIVMPGIAV